ncbi:Uncharacterised protein [Vibrio cholerae]|uniref:Uncharacterized protein n=1 Tax=Vibrio cholerae TaxID=666 RepID=A0A656AEZ7_VIBCL|nr:Uncharacterised protein [Vibrio cholerae]CSB59441.1 Uncharacterised protein [Vibrio cholerae]CSB62841.1 Uncharacterised protein [Vibrio cholerae]CSD04235.1 Uncharacterised protein [Vibrio cholerae]CSD18462.1 Uncharacterised protein [Vibrio cholerae]
MLARHSICPVSELRRNSRSETPARSRALTISTWLPSLSSVRTLVPAVTYKPDSTVQRSPSGKPKPAFAPSREFSPIDTTTLPPPESVPMMDAPPPMSEPLPTTTPAEIRPSTMLTPVVPALKLMKPSCMTVVPSPTCAPRRTREVSAIRIPAGTT